MKTNLMKESFNGFRTLTPEDDMFNDSRVIWFTENVTPKTCEQLAIQIMALEKAAPGRTITLMINSPGGEVLSGLAVYDLLRSISSPVRTVVFGIAASMGSLLLLAGDERIVTPHSRVLIHDPHYASDMSGLKPLDLKENLEQLLETREVLAKIIAERTGNSLETVYAKTKDDTYMSAEESLSFGLATKIASFIPSDINNELTKGGNARE